MRNASRCLTITLLMLTSTAAVGAQKADLAGIWEGTLDVGMQKLRIVFHVNKGGDAYSATMDSPDQGANGIPVDQVTLNGDAVEMTVKRIGGTYTAKLGAGGQEMIGRWKQGPADLQLDVKRVEKASETKRPQNPSKPYPYDEEEVAYENKAAGVKLGGTLTLPRDGRPCPAVLLITGSGPQDRDESLMGHKPFLVLADHLTRAGIAVLRVDDRGVGKSTGKTSDATTDDFAGDALAGVDYLKNRKEIDAKHIGLIGHSEGGLVAPLAASKSKDVAFIVMIAGTGVTGEEILYAQAALINKAMGATDDNIAQNRKIQELIFGILKAEKDNDKAKAKIREDVRKAIEELEPADRAQLGDIDAFVNAQAEATTSPWFRYFLTHDPRPTLKQVKCPVLAVIGEKDLQVPPKQNIPEIEKALKAGGNKDVTVQELKGLNHLLQTATTGAVSEYSQIEETMSPAALDTISSWIRSKTGLKP